MLKNYFKIAFRNLKKHKFYSFINIFGLATAFAILTLISLYSIVEFSYDKFNEKIDNIYRLDNGDWGIMAPAHGSFIKDKIPEVKDAVRFDTYRGQNALIETENNQLKIQHFVFADPSIFNIFTMEIIKGNIRNFSNKHFSVILSETYAKKIFGKENPIGKFIKYKKSHELEVIAIMSDLPNSHLKMDAIGNILAIPEITGQKEMMERFNGANWPTYLLLDKNASAESVTKKINQIPRYTENNSKYNLKSLKKLYFNKEANYEAGTVHGNIKMLYSLMIIAFFIIFMASINFINLTTALSGLRTKEIGIRKAIGSNRRQLVIQFLLEAILIALISFIISLVITDLILPVFNSILNINLDLNFYNNANLLFTLLSFSIFIGLISGLYPAFYISNHKVTEIFSPKHKSFLKGGILRNVLTVIQIGISAFLIFSTFIVYSQLNYLQKKDLGINLDKILIVNLNSELQKKKDLFLQKLENNNSIVGVTTSNAVPGNIGWQESRMINGENKQFTFHLCDDSFFDLYGIEKIKGKYLKSGSEASNYLKILVNETAMKHFGFTEENVIGSKFGNNVFKTKFGNEEKPFEIIGLVKDFHFNSLYEDITPLVITGFNRWNFQLSIKLKGNQIKSGLKHIEKTFNEMCPGYPFSYRFLEHDFDNFYKKEEKLGELFILFSLIAISIASLGIFGLTAFQTKKRYKEIGIRKVLGANPPSIVNLLLKSNLIILLISNTLAIIFNYLIMNKWLEIFPFRISISFYPYLIGFVISGLITILTISIIVLKVANQNPVKSLKYE